MNDDVCPTCSGTGKVLKLRKPAGYHAPINNDPYGKCPDCDGTGKR